MSQRSRFRYRKSMQRPSTGERTTLGVRASRAPEVLALTAVVVSCIVVLTALGRSSLATPPVGDLSDLQDWFEANDPFTAALSIVRIIALVAGWYVLATIVLGVLARAFGSAPLVAITDRVTLPAVQKMLGRAASITLTVSTLSVSAVPIVATVWSGPAGNLAEFAAAEEPGSSDLFPWGPAFHGSVLDQSASDGLAPPTMERLDGAKPEADLEGDRAGSGAVMTRETADDDDGVASDEWLIETGDHLWCVAESILTDAWGRAPSEAEIIDYWATLIDVNQDRLVDPDNPDLVLPGQVFVIPEVPSQS